MSESESQSPKSSQVVASENSDVNVTSEQVGYEEPIPAAKFEYNMIVGVNHSFFANVVTEEGGIYQPSDYVVFDQNVYDEVSSSHYDSIPNVNFGGDSEDTSITDETRLAVKVAEKESSLVWFREQDPDVAENETDRDLRAGQALYTSMTAGIKPLVQTQEFVDTIRGEVVPLVWPGTPASIYAASAVKTLLGNVETSEVHTFYTLQQCVEIMKSLRVLGRFNSYNFEPGEVNRADGSTPTTHDVEINWISFQNGDSLGVPVNFKALETDIIEYGNIRAVGTEVAFALKFVVTNEDARDSNEVKPSKINLLSNVENIDWQYKPATSGDSSDPPPE
jgi:hypothetical protein